MVHQIRIFGQVLHANPLFDTVDAFVCQHRGPSLLIDGIVALRREPGGYAIHLVVQVCGRLRLP